LVLAGWDMPDMRRAAPSSCALGENDTHVDL